MSLTLPDRFLLRIELESDWHVGAGFGRSGDIDRLVRRDSDGCPYLPAKTLTGVWRDACEQVATALDDGQNAGAWQAWVDVLFGSQPALVRSEAEARHQPRSAALAIRPARLPQSVRDVTAAKPALREALTFVRPGVKIDPRTQAAETDFLRFEEMARGGISLEAPCRLTLDGDDEHRTTASVLLLTGAWLITGIGGKRRRGAGRCRVTVERFDDYDEVRLQLAARLDQHPTPPDPAARTTAAPGPAGSQVPTGPPRGWQLFDYQLTTRTPVLVGGTALGNVVVGDDRVAGRYLLPIVCRALSRAGVDPAAAIADDHLVVTDATLDVGGAPVRPLPLTFYHPKDRPSVLYNRMVEPDPGGPATLQQARHGWIAHKGSVLGSVPVRVETHNTIHDPVQRPTSDVGGVYTYEAIDAGTTLRGSIRITDTLADALTTTWWQTLNGEQRIGRSSKDDYGQVDLTVTRAAAPPPPLAGDDGTLTVLLLSDTVLRDSRLRPAPTVEALAAELGQRLGVRLSPRQEPDRVTIAALQRRVDTWQATWGLPRPSLLALKAGTCVIFDVEGELDTAALEEINHAGIGERRAEGYGQLSCNDRLLAEARKGRSTPTARSAPERPVSSNGQFPDWLATVEESAWRTALRRAGRARAASKDGRREVLGLRRDTPPNSQLGGLRSVVARVGTEHGQRFARDWLTHLRANPRRADRWPAGALDKVELLLTSPERVWEVLALPTDALSASSERVALHKETLWAEAVQTLVAECVHAHQRDLEPRAEQDSS